MARAYHVKLQCWEYTERRTPDDNNNLWKIPIRLTSVGFAHARHNKGRLNPQAMKISIDSPDYTWSQKFVYNCLLPTSSIVRGNVYIWHMEQGRYFIVNVQAWANCWLSIMQWKIYLLYSGQLRTELFFCWCCLSKLSWGSSQLQVIIHSCGYVSIDYDSH